ncbi:MAG TPA: zinc ribbon domain-containing protein, partial [Smithellaceae bacterium]|nr:zinc ribbon domain-containing protein [Smithellaceae bacterium]
MPIYEFYCSRCRTIYNFFSRLINTEKVPFCPRCPDAPLQRQMSVFATVSGAKESDADNPFSALDEKKMEKELAKLASTAEKMGNDNPRAAAELMRKFSAMTGRKMGKGFAEALQRMENGEDPEIIEAEM